MEALNTAPGAIDLSGLQTESRNSTSMDIDRISTIDLVRVMNREDASVAPAVVPCLEATARAIDILAERVRLGGRVFYIGAGTSGRLGVLDASEIPPTYSAPPGQFVALMAGGDRAIRSAVEGAEDDYNGAARDLASLQLDPKMDSLIGIAASGRTPYVLGGMAYAKARGCVTVGIVCVRPSAMEAASNADIVIAPVTGPEVMTGSTRMKAGTATKLVLNMISTGIMIRVGKTYGNLMIDLKATNLKLKQRAKNILRSVGGAFCPQSDQEIEALLEECEGSVKLAAAAMMLQKPVHFAHHALESNGGSLARVVEDPGRQHEPIPNGPADPDAESFVVAVDAGGTSCSVVLMDRSRHSWTAQGGPCNVATVGIEAAMAIISESVQRAVNAHPTRSAQPLSSIPISHAWVGMAGYDRATPKPPIENQLATMLGVKDGSRLRVTADVDLLTASVSDNPLVKSAIVLIAGTGSVAMRFRREANGRFIRTARVGGWGHALGDDGSGYWMGRMGLRAALAALDVERLHRTIAQQDDSRRDISNDGFVEQILAHIVDSSNSPEGAAWDLVTHATKHGIKGIAEFSRIVLDNYTTSPAARAIANDGARSLADLVEMLALEPGINSPNTVLVLAGGLTGSELYRRLITKHLLDRSIDFSSVQTVEQPALAAAATLCQEMHETD
ncbi:putative glucokinase regulator family protein [Thelonectria olida]|uniref:N-acetyl-D-glucosamine kinase n=1 Tax=Thelonectria olida TaxID=1576542 RepID=A0A9P9AKW6_9HYPO|nr:putative glucokinase regulator family protein [Thelonectria olida]